MTLVLVLRGFETSTSKLSVKINLQCWERSSGGVVQNEIKRSRTKLSKAKRRDNYDFAISLKYSNSIMNKSRAIFVIVTFEKGKIDI